MEATDTHMTGGIEGSSSSVQSLDSLKQTLEQSLSEINKSISMGIREIKTDLSDQVQTILIAIPRQNTTQGSSGISGLLGNFGISGGSSSEVEHWKEQFSFVSGNNERLLRENDHLKLQHERNIRQKEQECRALEINMGNLERASKDTHELQQRLAVASQQNQELREQNSRFREIILKKTSSQAQTTPDSTIIHSFGNLRFQIQHIVFKFFRIDRLQQFKMKTLSKDQQDFFVLWIRKHSDSQLKMRIRGKIFDLLAREILCRPIFGLDDYDSKGVMEAELSRFESAIKPHVGVQEEDIAEWRWRTVKNARLIQCPKSKHPNRVMDDILRFFEPIAPEKKSEKLGQLRDLLLALCTSAFNLTLELRESKDLYKCEVPSPGSAFLIDQHDQQDSEGTPDTEPARIAFAISGALVKYPEHQAGTKIVLEKAHVVTCD